MKNLFLTTLCATAILIFTAASCNTSKNAAVNVVEVTETSEVSKSDETKKEAGEQVVVTTQSENQINDQEGEQLDKGMSVSPAQELASIKRTPCYGQCPMYRMTILDNGQVVYEGKRFVEKIGTYSGLLTSEDLETILKVAKETNYLELEDAYDVPVADFPTCVTSFTSNGKTKRVMNKQGAPPSLKKFEMYLDSLIEGLELTKLSDEVNY
jgi:hypothetical protein